jgi:hypothetical protein
MTPRKEPTDSGHSEDWVFVSHEENRDERHPQYNEDNESSTQLASANAATDDGNHSHAHHDGNMTTEHEKDRLALCRKTESNGTSTETDSTNTVTGLDAGSAGRNAVVNIHPSNILTEYTLNRLQSELHQGYAADIPGWVKGTFYLSALANDVESSMQHSMLVRSGKSRASTVSSMSLDHEHTQPAIPLTHDFCEMGAWC